jgi:hypothetical protein
LISFANQMEFYNIFLKKRKEKKRIKKEEEERLATP